MDFKKLKPVCGVTRRWLCPCLFGERFSKQRPHFLPIMEQWQQVELEVVSTETSIITLCRSRVQLTGVNLIPHANALRSFANILTH